MKRNQQYWTPAEHSLVKQAKSFTDLVPAALAILERMPKPISQVCGPISTGGLGNIEKNIAVFDATIDHFINQGISVFDQIPFEEHIFRIVKNKWNKRQNDLLLEEFYHPIFQSGHVSRLYFINDWRSSEGATWEHDLAEQLNMEIIYLEPNLVKVT